MEIYDFFNSKEEADYLRDMEYEFTMPEQAYVIYQSKYTTIIKKMLAWRDLTNMMPDIEPETFEALPPEISFHEFLWIYCCLQEELLYRFFEPGDAIYQYATYQNVYETGSDREGIWKFVENPCCFSDFKNCYDEWFSGYKKHGLVCPGARPPRVRFLRREVLKTAEQTSPCIWIEIELNEKLISIQEQHFFRGWEKKVNEAFQNMHFTFPTPFRRGDILVNNWVGYAGYKKGPFVLDRIEGDRYLAVYLGEYESGPHLFRGSDGPVLNLERYKEPLKGPQKVLKGISSAMAEETKDDREFDPALKCQAYSLVLEEELCRSNEKDISFGKENHGY